jgi:hypothetical protein
MRRDVAAIAEIETEIRPQSIFYKRNRPPLVRVSGTEMVDEQDQQDRTRASLYRQSASGLRRIAAELRFDLCRRQQLLSLAGGFDRLADKLEGSPLKHAAD